MKIKVLVVEDRLSLNRSIVNMLNKEDYIAFSALDMDTAKETFLNEKPHIVLLDIMLPQGYGYNLITFFRKYHDSWILMVTALDDEQSKRICFENGADDYITKPFDLYELLYKLKAIKRRISMNLKECQIGDITFNTNTNKITCKEKTIVIQPSQMKFLKLIYDKYLENSYVNKFEAFDKVGKNINETGRLQTLVARLRKNLFYIGSEQIDIETIYGKGYRIIVEKNKIKGKINE
jgi:DNA-binding response OmpR family regulator